MARIVMEFRVKVTVDGEHATHSQTRGEVRLALQRVLEEHVDPLHVEESTVRWSQIDEVE